MGVLETVFNSKKFDLNDDVLMKFSNYFDEDSKGYNRFSLDEEDIPTLRNFVERIKSIDSDSKIFVCTYGYEMTNDKGEKLTYADTLWIDTSLPLSKIEELISESDINEPSDISFVKDIDENGKGKTWLVTQEEEQSPKIIELTDRKKINYMIALYWD